MRIVLLGLMLMGCDASGRFGTQEGEPIAPPAAEGIEDADPDLATGGFEDCSVVAHCMGDGWCAEYSEQTRPDLEEECAGFWEEGPCDTEAALGNCPAGDDACTSIWWYDDRADKVCTPSR